MIDTESDKKREKERESPLSCLEIKVPWGQMRGKDEPCCAPVAHLLLYGPPLPLLCHTARRLPQDSAGRTKREREKKQKQDSFTGEGNEREREYKWGKGLTQIFKLSCLNSRPDCSCCMRKLCNEPRFLITQYNCISNEYTTAAVTAHDSHCSDKYVTRATLFNFSRKLRQNKPGWTRRTVQATLAFRDALVLVYGAV